MKIIIAEDNEGIKKLTTRKVQRSIPDATIDTVDSKAQLLDKIKAGEYDLIISDNNMGNGGEGLSAAEEFRELGNQTPFLLHTTDTITPLEAESAGVTEVIEKDSGLENLGYALERYKTSSVK